MRNRILKLSAIAIVLSAMFASCMEHCPIDEKEIKTNGLKKIRMIKEYTIQGTDTATTHQIGFDENGNIKEYNSVYAQYLGWEHISEFTFNRVKDTLYIKDKDNQYLFKLAYDKNGRIVYKYKELFQDFESAHNVYYEYDSRGNLIKSKNIENLGIEVRYSYDSKNRVITEEHEEVDNSAVNGYGRLTYSYDEKDRVTSVRSEYVDKKTKKAEYQGTYTMKYKDIDKKKKNNFALTKENMFLPIDLEHYHNSGTIQTFHKANLDIGREASDKLVLTGEESELTYINKKGKKSTKKYSFEFNEEGSWVRCAMEATTSIGDVIKSQLFREITYYN